jgi:hypothetical protein
MNLMLLGAVAMACYTASLFFLRFWKDTGDRFFLFFALSFCIEGTGRLLLSLSYSSEYEPFIYMVRLFAFGIILLAIADKNRRT